jgi:hypothetical protein
VTELQLHLAATKALLLAFQPWMDDAILRDVRSRLRADLSFARQEEDRLVCLNALQLLEAGLVRRP